MSISYNFNNNSFAASTTIHVQSSNAPRRSTLKQSIEARIASFGIGAKLIQEISAFPIFLLHF